MSKFLTGTDLEETIYDIIWKAERTLLIVSPFIKLDSYFREVFDNHRDNPKIHLLIVFGKNEKEVKKSMSKEDFDYFKKFLNVSIIYVPNLHAKYYGNEKQGIITSINLYDYSFKNNIEFGVFSEQSILDRFKSSTDNDAWDECIDIAKSNEVVFIKRPVYETKKVIINISKNYVKSEILFDSTDKFYGVSNNIISSNKKLYDFPEELASSSSHNDRPKRNDHETSSPQKPKELEQKSIDNTNGHCIRCDKSIKLNPLVPYCKECYKVWNKYGDDEYLEEFCHICGTNHDTSMLKPTCYSCYKANKTKLNFNI